MDGRRPGRRKTPGAQDPAYRPARPPGTWSPAPTEGGSAVGQQERSRYLSRFLNTSRRPTARRRPKIRSCTLGFVCIALAWRPDAVPGGNIPSQLPAELAPGVGGEIDWDAIAWRGDHPSNRNRSMLRAESRHRSCRRPRLPRALLLVEVLGDVGGREAGKASGGLKDVVLCPVFVVQWRLSGGPRIAAGNRVGSCP
jgi:hypothetical protein